MKHKQLLLILIVFLLAACSSASTAEPVLTAETLAATEVETEAAEEAGEEKPETAVDAQENTPTTLPTSTSTPEPREITSLPADYPEEGYGPDNFPDNVNPLTGLKVDNPELLNRRPILIKITNFPREIRPQWGLTSADLVYEYYHNGGLTRFVALFYGQDAEQVAPIRSARFSDENFIRMYKGTLTFGGTYDDVRDNFYKSNFSNQLLYTVTSKPCPATILNPVCRFDPDGMNHLMTDTSILQEYFEDNGLDDERQDLDGMIFKAAPPANGDNGTELRVRFTDSNFFLWQFNEKIGEYVRYQEKEDTTEDVYEILSDRVNNTPISADNIVVLVVYHKPMESDHEDLRFNLIDTGKAFAFRDGKLYRLQWNRPTRTDLLTLTFLNGEPYPMRPGTTWFEVIGINSEIKDVQNGLNIKANVP
jgi:hypothetical protein